MKKFWAASIAASSLAFAGSSAHAAVVRYDFTIGSQVTGYFNTNAPSTTDVGYNSITDIAFTKISGTDLSGLNFSYTNEVDQSINTGAAYNPSTGKFVNHANGNTYADSGIINTPNIFDFSGLGSGGNYSGINKNDPAFSNDDSSGSIFIVPGTLSVTPEPASLSVLAVAGIILVRRRS